MAEHEGLRGIVHTVNSNLATDLVRMLSGFPFNRAGLFSHRTEDRAEVFAAFHIASPPAVLVSPSVDVGEDFADDQARWQAIAKVPYPPRGDQWVKAKQAMDPNWYDEQAVRGLVQAAGRIARGPEDWGTTYILDEQFEKLYERRRDSFPDWFHEGIQAGVGIRSLFLQ